MLCIRKKKKTNRQQTKQIHVHSTVKETNNATIGQLLLGLQVNQLRFLRTYLQVLNLASWIYSTVLEFFGLFLKNKP